MQIILPLVVILGIFHTIRIYLAGRAARKEYQACNYTDDSTPNSEPWRWRCPGESTELQLDDTEQQSSIEFSPDFNSMDYFLGAAAFLALVAAAACLLAGLYFRFVAEPVQSMRSYAGFTMAGIGLIFGFASLSVRQRAVRFIRTPTQLIVEYTYGAFLRRKLRYNRGCTVSVAVKEQSITDYDVSQERPFYQLTLRRVHFFSLTAARFYVYANPSQMSWVEGGLNHWFAGEESEMHQPPA